MALHSRRSWIKKNIALAAAGASLPMLPHAANATRDVFEVKKALGVLGVTEFPVLLNDALNRVLDLSIIEENLKLKTTIQKY